MDTKTERKRTLTLNLSDAEMSALAELADHQGMSKSAVLRQALRLYHWQIASLPGFKDKNDAKP